MLRFCEALQVGYWPLVKTVRKVDIQTRIVDKIAILEIHGEVTHSEGSAELREKIQEVLKTGVKNILFNTQGVTRIDSLGIGELLSCYTQVKKEGGETKLLHAGKMLHQILANTNLLGILETYDDEQEAIASFS